MATFVLMRAMRPIIAALLCLCAGVAEAQLLDNNLKVVDLSDLEGPLPLDVVSTTQILWQTEDWEIPTWQNPNWPAPTGADSVGYPSIAKNDRGPGADGKYYLYYSHHDPSSGIGVAVAESITGTYSKSVTVPGRSDNQVVPSFQFPAVPDSPDHNASPSVVWNEDEQLWFMYFHYYNHLWGQTQVDGLTHQLTALATTPDLASHDWTVWEDDSFGTAPPYVPVLPTTHESWINSQSSYNAIQRLPNGEWLAFLRGTSDAAGEPTKLGFATSLDGRDWAYFDENPVIHQGPGGNGGKAGVDRPGFVAYLGENDEGTDEYLVAWSEADYFDSNVEMIYATTTDFLTFERDPRGYANWFAGDGIVNAWREGNRLYLFTGKLVHEMVLPVAVPEPSTWVFATTSLVFVSLWAVAVRRRRRCCQS